MKKIKGDLIKLALAGRFSAIVHGCNCQCTMGAGIAKTIKAEFPEASEADKQTVKGDRAKLGSVSSATVNRSGHQITIINGYTQYHWKGRGVKADYQAIRDVMKLVKINWSGQTIGYPLIGAGLAGGDWNVISSIIDEELEGENHTLVEFVP